MQNPATTSMQGFARQLLVHLFTPPSTVSQPCFGPVLNPSAMGHPPLQAVLAPLPLPLLTSLHSSATVSMNFKIYFYFSFLPATGSFPLDAKRKKKKNPKKAPCMFPSLQPHTNLL